MRSFARPIRLVCLYVTVSLSALGIYLPAAEAALVGTQQVLDNGHAVTARQRVESVLARQDVAAQLVANGVDPARVQTRLDGLTDTEMQTLAAQLDQLPAGAGALEIVLLVFVVLLLTDLLGLTHIFAFVHRR